MIRQHLGARNDGDDPEFRWRGGEVSRLEAFSDAVFAFSLTLLVVSLDVPRSIDALFSEMTNFLAFGVAFLILYYLWYQHYIFFRRFGLSDKCVVVTNGILLFLVVFFVYPMKFLLIYVINGVFLYSMFNLPVDIPIDLRGVDRLTYPILFSLYAFGFSAIYLCYRQLYVFALARADRLGLDADERRLTCEALYRYTVFACVPLFSSILAWSIPVPYGGHVSGFSLSLIGFLAPLGRWLGRRHYLKRYATTGET